jgi:Pyruvate/2-oxoacid:ferredoxin oxidoreductase delta subunit
MGSSSKAGSGRAVVSVHVDVAARMQGFDSAKKVTGAHRRLMKHYSSVLLFGPPPGEALLELVAHMFTEDEADAAQHLAPLRPLTAKQVARRCGQSPERIKALLDNLAENKRVILWMGKPRRYTILPLVPGTFEMAIVTPELARANSWHKRFAGLFEKVWDTGYITGYLGRAPAPLRYIPAQSNASRVQAAFPAEMIEELLAPYDVFGIAHCQCRVVTDLSGRGCGKPTENCVAIGPVAEPLLARGLMRRADRAEVIEAKRVAEEHGCVTWMMNGGNPREGNYSCSCCGCCCHALRTVTQFSAPGLFAPPRFMPRLDPAACVACGRCATACPMRAWSLEGGSPRHDAQRCIGCGLCVSACENDALDLIAVRKEGPERDYGTLMLKMLPAYAAASFREWLRRSVAPFGSGTKGAKP